MYDPMNNMVQGLYHQIELLAKQVSSNKEESCKNKRVKSYAEKLKTKSSPHWWSSPMMDITKQRRKKGIVSKIATQVDEVKDSKVGRDVSDSSRIKGMTPKTHTFYHLPRVEKTGSGVGVFVSESFPKVTVRNQVIFDTFEYMDLEIPSKNKVIRLITLYRPPTIDGKGKEIEFIKEFGN